MICTSMWRGFSTNFSISMRSSPKAALASRLAPTSAAASSPAERTIRMPRPPPPADALTRTGKPILPAAFASVASSLGFALIAGPQRHAGFLHQHLRTGFRAHRPDHLGGRADEYQSRVETALREFS